MNRPLSSVATAPVVSKSVGPVPPVTAYLPREQSTSAQEAAPARNALRTNTSYVGRSYLTRSRHNSSAGRQSMFRVR